MPTPPRLTPADAPPEPVVLRPWAVLLGLVAFCVTLWLPTSMPPAAQRLAAVTVAMAIWWLTQAVDIAVTSLVPIFALPLLGVQTSAEVCQSYMSKNIMLFLGGFVIALGIERWGLHRRIALHIVSRSGSGLNRVLLGFMVATGFLSMWISNTASTLMMMPIGLALVASLREVTLREIPADRSESAAEVGRTLDSFATRLMLAIAYSASIGGICTLVGTLPNVVFADIWRTKFPEAEEIGAGQWIMLVLPIGICVLGSAWLVLRTGLRELPPDLRRSKEFFGDELAKLGPITTPERRMFGVFVVTAALWIFRKPLVTSFFVVPGWGPIVEGWLMRAGVAADVAGKSVDDATVSVMMAVLLFVIPSGHRSKSENADLPRAVVPLMDWTTANRLPWGILLLVGGGLALAGAFGSTGLSEWVGNSFADSIRGLPTWAIVSAICLLVTFLTELTSNTATTSTLLPILASVAVALKIDPVLVMLPATLSASCAFMLPVATPPNAIVFGSGRVTIRQMASFGVVLNLIAAFWVALGSLLWIAPRFGL